MSIADENKIDAITVSEKESCLILHITDHLDWKDEPVHLLLLQDKLNAYLAFVEGGQWKEYAPSDKVIDHITIEIHFKYEITQNCEKFLQYVQDQVGQMGIKIRGVIAG